MSLQRLTQILKSILVYKPQQTPEQVIIEHIQNQRKKKYFITFKYNTQSYIEHKNSDYQGHNLTAIISFNASNLPLKFKIFFGGNLNFHKIKKLKNAK